MSETTQPMVETDLPTAILGKLREMNAPQTVTVLVGKVKPALGLPKKTSNKAAEPAASRAARRAGHVRPIVPLPTDSEERQTRLLRGAGRDLHTKRDPLGSR